MVSKKAQQVFLWALWVLTGHEELRVGVIVDVKLEALGRLDLLDVGREGLELDRVARSSTFVVFSTGIGRCASWDIPLEIPVSVDITTDA